MYQLLLVIHVMSAVLLVTFILLQQGKGATTGAAFGSGASNTVFGSVGAAGFLGRATWFLVTVFFVVNLGLAYLTNSYARRDSISDLSTKPATVTPAEEIPDSTQQDTSVGNTNPADVPDE